MSMATHLPGRQDGQAICALRHNSITPEINFKRSHKKKAHSVIFFRWFNSPSVGT